MTSPKSPNQTSPLYNQMDEQMDPTEISSELFNLRIQKAKKVYLDEKVRGLSTRNENGILSIVARYAQCIAFIEDLIIINKEDGSKIELTIHNGLLRVENGNVFIFLDAQTP